MVGGQVAQEVGSLLRVSKTVQLEDEGKVEVKGLNPAPTPTSWASLLHPHLLVHPDPWNPLRWPWLSAASTPSSVTRRWGAGGHAPCSNLYLLGAACDLAGYGLICECPYLRVGSL